MEKAKAISIIDKKIALLQSYKTSLEWLFENAENSSNDDIYTQLNMQTAYIEQLKEIEANATAKDTIMLQQNLKIAEYNQLLSEIMALNKNVVNKIQCLAGVYKNKMKHARGQKNIISNYQLFNNNTAGNLFDYKEGVK